MSEPDRESSDLDEENSNNPKNLFRKKGYKIAGSHSGVKTCHWLKKSIREEGVCYKQKFYGIESHRCLQMTPTLSWCTLNCKFCWRPMEKFRAPEEMKNMDTDEPEKIIDKSLDAQEELLNGFWGAKDKISVDKLEEAFKPKNVAISLSGEPTLYEDLPELVKKFHDRDMTTFIVTNGTLPDKLKKLKDKDALPTQLYVSLTTPDQSTFSDLNLPFDDGRWNDLIRSLEFLDGLDTRTVLRLTLVDSENMHSPKEYARLIKKAKPMFIEPKAYMYVGYSRKRLEEENMPSNKRIRDFTEEILEYLPNYHIEDKQEQSRVLMLMRDDLDKEDRFI